MTYSCCCRCCIQKLLFMNARRRGRWNIFAEATKQNISASWISSSHRCVKAFKRFKLNWTFCKLWTTSWTNFLLVSLKQSNLFLFNIHQTAIWRKQIYVNNLKSGTGIRPLDQITAWPELLLKNKVWFPKIAKVYINFMHETYFQCKTPIAFAESAIQWNLKSTVKNGNLKKWC